MDGKKDFICLCISIGSFLLTASSFLMMPIDSVAGNAHFLNNLPGIIFWFFLVLGIAAQIILTQRRKKWLSNNRIKKVITVGNRIGVISFMKNIPAIIADIVCALSVVVLVIALIVTDGTGYICYVFVALLFFSFCMHCILNGKNYFFIKNKDSILAKLKEERSKLSEKE